MTGDDVRRDAQAGISARSFTTRWRTPTNILADATGVRQRIGICLHQPLPSNTGSARRGECWILWATPCRTESPDLRRQANHCDGIEPTDRWAKIVL